MKKIFLIIVTICLFSIPNISLADSTTLNTLLDIQTGPEVWDIENTVFPSYTFTEPSLQKTYDEYVSKMKALRVGIVKEYSNGTFEYYQMSGIVETYKSYVYYTNQMFSLSLQREAGNTDKYTSAGIKRNYEKSRTFYNRLRSLVFNK